MKILAPTEANIQVCANELMNGRLVGIPTETVYGLAGVATEEEALAKIFKTKERPTFDPLIVHVSLEKNTLASLMREGLVDMSRLSDLAVKRTDQLIRAFWPGPLTLVLPRTDLVPDLATSGLDTVAIRAPAHEVARKLIEAVELPLCAPSANRFGRISPTRAEDVVEELGERVNYVLDGGPCAVGVESTIVHVGESGVLTLLRPGGISSESIENVIGSPLQKPETLAQPGLPARAPGMLASHYAPRKRLILLPERLDQMMSAPKLGVLLPKKVGLLSLRGKASDQAEILSELIDREVVAESLSESGDWDEAARNLFRMLRALDQSDAELLLAEPCEEKKGLGFAISDRLRRAAAPRD